MYSFLHSYPKIWLHFILYVYECDLLARQHSRQSFLCRFGMCPTCLTACVHWTCAFLSSTIALGWRYGMLSIYPKNAIWKSVAGSGSRKIGLRNTVGQKFILCICAESPTFLCNQDFWPSKLCVSDCECECDKQDLVTFWMIGLLDHCHCLCVCVWPFPIKW